LETEDQQADLNKWNVS